MPGLQAGDPPSSSCRRREAAEQSAASFYSPIHLSHLALFLLCVFCPLSGSAALLEESTRAHLCLMPPGEEVLSSAVPVVTGGGAHATGVVVARDRVITSLHVVDGAEAVWAEIHGFRWLAGVVASDAGNDLALLEVRTFNIESLALNAGALLEAEVLWAVGFPLAGERQVTAGQYLGRAGAKLKSSATVAAGFSGGALMRCSNEGFELAGMITGHTAETERFALAAPAAEIYRLLEAAGR